MSQSGDNHSRFTVLLRNEHRDRLRHLQKVTGSPSENAVVIALLAEVSDEQCKEFYERALARGAIAPKLRLSVQQKMLLEAAKAASPEQVAVALAVFNGAQSLSATEGSHAD